MASWYRVSRNHIQQCIEKLSSDVWFFEGECMLVLDSTRRSRRYHGKHRSLWGLSSLIHQIKWDWPQPSFLRALMISLISVLCSDCTRSEGMRCDVWVKLKQLPGCLIKSLFLSLTDPETHNSTHTCQLIATSLPHNGASAVDAKCGKSTKDPSASV